MEESSSLFAILPPLATRILEQEMFHMVFELTGNNQVCKPVCFSSFFFPFCCQLYLIWSCRFAAAGTPPAPHDPCKWIPEALLRGCMCIIICALSGQLFTGDTHLRRYYSPSTDIAPSVVRWITALGKPNPELGVRALLTYPAGRLPKKWNWKILIKSHN